MYLLQQTPKESEKTVHRMGENICKSRFNNGLVFRIDKDVFKLNDKHTNDLTKKLAKDLNRCFSKEGIQMALTT